MRIGMICPYSMGIWGGVQSQVVGLARTLRAQGIDVQVLAPCDGLPPEPWITPLGNSMPYAQNGSLAPVAPDASAQLRALAAVWDERFDLLHLHEPLAPGPTLTTLVVKPLPLIGTFHASGDIAAYRWMRPLLRRLVMRLDVRVAVSSAAANMASRHLGGQYEVLFNGIEVPRFANADPAPTRGPTVFFLARHEPRKGLAVLIEASRLLPDDVTIWIGGQGPETQALRAANADNHRLVWLGQMTESDKIAALRGSDVFCVPSLGGESFGIVLLEGMAAGTPVVASDLDAYRITSRNASAATLFRTGVATDLARALRLALDRGAAVESQVARGHARAAEFSMENLADAYRIRYLRLLD